MINLCANDNVVYLDDRYVALIQRELQRMGDALGLKGEALRDYGTIAIEEAIKALKAQVKS